MKKIVALVLCLALALSLCTVAFAASLKEVTGGTVATTTVDGFSEWKLEAYHDSDSTHKHGQEYTLSGKKDGNWIAHGVKVVETNKAGAQWQFVEGNTVKYLRETVAYTKTLTKLATVDQAAAKNCHDLYTAGDATAYVDADGNYYIDGTGVVALYDGKTINVQAVAAVTPIDDNKGNDTAAIYLVKHEDLDIDVEDDDNDVESVVAVECDECDKSLAFVASNNEDKAITKFGVGKYVQYTTVKLNDVDTKVFLPLTVTTVASTSTSTTVESAKTFDAGIALYAGMALASVAGSAVVIGKKKEF